MGRWPNLREGVAEDGQRVEDGRHGGRLEARSDRASPSWILAKSFIDDDDLVDMDSPYGIRADVLNHQCQVRARSNPRGRFLHSR